MKQFIVSIFLLLSLTACAETPTVNNPPDHYYQFSQWLISTYGCSDNINGKAVDWTAYDILVGVHAGQKMAITRKGSKVTECFR